MARPSSAALIAALTACLAAVGCDDSSPAALDGGLPDAGHPGLEPYPAQLEALWRLLPQGSRGVMALNLTALHARGALPALLAPDAEPALRAPLALVEGVAPGLLAPGSASSLLLLLAEPSLGPVVLARLAAEPTTALGVPLTDDGAHGSPPVPLFRDPDQRQVALLPDRHMVVGSPAGVRAVLDDLGRQGVPPGGGLAGYRATVSPQAHLSFVYQRLSPAPQGGPANPALDAGFISGNLTFSQQAFDGHVRLGVPDPASFADELNRLNRSALVADPPLALPVAYDDTFDGDLLIQVPTTPIQPTPEQALASRDLAKKLFVGLQAHRYAEGVADPGDPAWVDFKVKGGGDGGEPPSPSSVFVRWAFRDEAAVQAFEANALPAGFRLTPTRFLESDPEGGAYFLALNIYNSGGGLVSGARAEWNVFVQPPPGADPEAGARPRFMVVDALAQTVSADPVNLVTPAEPVSYAFDGDDVVARVDRLVDGAPVPVLSLRFPKPEPGAAPAARFTRELAIANDYIYWGHGVYDRVLYTASVFNRDALLADVAQAQIADDSRWAQSLQPEPLDVVYYQNPLEFVASPMANLRSEQLDITPAWREALLAFKTNGHQRALMRSAVAQLFRGVGEALIPQPLPNIVPAVLHHFTVTDPAALAAQVGLPPGYTLRPIQVSADEAEAHTLTMAVYESPEPREGLRVEWRTYADAGDGRPRTLVLDAQTEHPALDPVRLLNLPSAITHAPGGVQTTLQAPGYQVRGTLAPSDARITLSRDWIEAGDHRCWRNGVCDQVYADGQTLDVPARVGQASFQVWQTPWDAHIEATPRLSVLRSHPQPRVVKRWYTVKVPVPEPPVEGLPDATHTLSGGGTLAGRDTDVVDSEYTYTGDAVVEADRLRFAMDQQIDNLLGEAHIFTTGSFQLATGMGSQTVVGCQGPALMCSDVVPGSTALYIAQALDASDPSAITWAVDLVVDLGGSFGLADSASRLTATAR